MYTLWARFSLLYNIIFLSSHTRLIYLLTSFSIIIIFLPPSWYTHLTFLLSVFFMLFFWGIPAAHFPFRTFLVSVCESQSTVHHYKEYTSYRARRNFIPVCPDYLASGSLSVCPKVSAVQTHWLIKVIAMCGLIRVSSEERIKEIWATFEGSC